MLGQIFTAIALLLWASAASAASLPTERALDEMCAQLHKGLAEHPVVPVAVLPDDPNQSIARLTAEHISHCLDARGVYLVERRRMSALIQQLKLDQAAGDPEAVARLSTLSGAKSLIQIAMDDLGDQYTLTARLIIVEGGAVQAVTRPVRVSQQDWLTWRAEQVERKSRLVGVGLGVVMPGAGHLYHDRPALGWSILGVEAALAIGAIAFHMEGADEEARYREDTPDTVSARATAEQAYRTRNGLLWAFGAVYVLQLIHVALISPERLSPEGQVSVDSGALGWRF